MMRIGDGADAAAAACSWLMGVPLDRRELAFPSKRSAETFDIN